MLYALCAAAGYLIGSISVSVLLSKRKYGCDIRLSGSGNAGATNVARVLGLKAGLITLAGDMLKTGLAALIGYLLCGSTGLALSCAGCLIGHNHPVYFSFKGGKGVSVSACIALILDWHMFVMVLVIFFTVFLASRIVSLCSMTAALAFPPLWLLLGHGLDYGFMLCCLVTVSVIVMHIPNIRRLLAGTEPRFVPSGRR